MKLEEIIELDKQYFNPVFSRQEVCFVKGKGVYLYDTEGKKYTDFLSGIGVCCLGYSDEGYKNAVMSAVNNLMHTSNIFYIEAQAKLAKLLCSSTGYDNVFFSNSGAEAVEGALKLARKYHFGMGDPRYEIITLKDSFHGRTLATLAATGQERFHEAYKPLIDSFRYVQPNDIEELNKTVSSKTAAIMVEPIIGEGGVTPLTREYYMAVRAACDKYGALMIADEIQSGMGRTGALLASTALGAKPDIVVLAKALGGGVPIGAFLACGKAAGAFSTGDHGSTYGGNHLACAAACYVVEKLINSELLPHIAETGAYFFDRLCALKQRSSSIAAVRGKGLMLGIEFKPDITAKSVQKSLLDAGFVTATAGGNVLRFLPPYIIQRGHIDSLVEALQNLL